MIDIKINNDKLISLVEKKYYGQALEALLKINKAQLRKQELRVRSSIKFIKGILWELLGNFPKALNKYDSIIQMQPNNSIALQYYTQLLSKMGNIPGSKIYFKKLFQLNPEIKNPFLSKRNYLGFRDRTYDLRSLQFSMLDSNNNQEICIFLLGLINFSMLNIRKSIFFFKNLTESNLYVKIFRLIGQYFVYYNTKIIDEIIKIKLNNKNPLEFKLNNLIELLKTNNFTSKLRMFKYIPQIPAFLKKLLKSIPGWLDLCEGNLLYQLSKTIKNKKHNLKYIVEVGAFYGRSSICIAQGLKDRGGNDTLLSIDPHLGIPYYHHQPTIKQFLENIHKARVKEKIRVCRGTSEEWSSKISEEISMLFIDGDHTYEMVKKDLTLWEDKIMHNGLVAYHDAILDGPFRAINEIINSGKYEYLLNVGCIALFQKKNPENYDKMDILTIFNLILLILYRKFYLDFLRQDETSMKNKIIELIKLNSN